MDKKTIYVVIGCLLALFVWQRVVEQMYPPKKKPLKRFLILFRKS